MQICTETVAPLQTSVQESDRKDGGFKKAKPSQNVGQVEKGRHGGIVILRKFDREYSNDGMQYNKYF